MTQTSNRIFDEMARLMNDAAGVAQGVRKEFDTLFRAQAERILRDLDVVPREEFEAVKEMARLAREENEALKARVEALEGKGEGRQKGQQAGTAAISRGDCFVLDSGLGEPAPGRREADGWSRPGMTNNRLPCLPRHPPL